VPLDHGFELVPGDIDLLLDLRGGRLGPRHGAATEHDGKSDENGDDGTTRGMCHRSSHSFSLNRLPG
jgi:hypothetical protein